MDCHWLKLPSCNTVIYKGGMTKRSSLCAVIGPLVLWLAANGPMNQFMWFSKNTIRSGLLRLSNHRDSVLIIRTRMTEGLLDVSASSWRPTKVCRQLLLAVSCFHPSKSPTLEVEDLQPTIPSFCSIFQSALISQAFQSRLFLPAYWSPAQWRWVQPQDTRLIV